MKYSRKAIAWAMYDWANSAFAVVVLAGLFPILHREYWASELPGEEITFTLALANSGSSILLMLVSILLGTIADMGGRQSSFLALCMAIGVGGTLALGTVSAGGWQLALIIYIVATFAFMLSNVFYDALLVRVSTPEERTRTSALGFALGYLGGGLLFSAVSVVILYAEELGFGDRHAAMQAGFYATGIWWLLFSLPLIFSVRIARSAVNIKESLQRFKSTIKLVLSHPGVGWFLLAYWLYIDGVDTIIRMAVDYGQALGFDANSLILALLLIQFIGFPATLLYGYFSEKVGFKVSILTAIGVYIVICIFGAMLETLTGFYMLAVLIALVQGGIQAQSRAFFSRLIPADKAAQFFGVYNLLGRFAVVIGPVLMGWVGVVTGSPRWGILSIVILLVLGGLALTRVPEVRGHNGARHT